jgi:hypothetical protein
MYGRRQGVILLLLFFLAGGPLAGAANAGPTPQPTVTAGQVVKFYVVKAAAENGKREFLFEIAEKTLGDGDRAPEIFALTKGRLQPDGGRLTDPAAIRPGWALILPDDAKGPGVQTGAVPGETKPAPRAASRKPVAGLTMPVVAGALAGFGLLIAMTAVVLIRRAPRDEEDGAAADEVEVEAEAEVTRRRGRGREVDGRAARPKRRRGRRLEFDEEADDDETAFASIAASLREENAGVWGAAPPGMAGGSGPAGLAGSGGEYTHAAMGGPATPEAGQHGPGFVYPGTEGSEAATAEGTGYLNEQATFGEAAEPTFRHHDGQPMFGPDGQGGGPSFGPGGQGDGPSSEPGGQGGGLLSGPAGQDAEPVFRPGGQGGVPSFGPGGQDGARPTGAGVAPLMPPEPPGVEPYRHTRPDIVVRDVDPGHGGATDTPSFPAEPGGPMYPGPAGSEIAHRVAFGDDLVTVRLLRTGRSDATAWRPLPHDVPAGMAVVCVGAASEGCLFLDLGAAPGPVAVEGPANVAERLAEAFVFQLAGDTSRATVAIVGSALESVTDGPGIRRVPNLGALALGQNESDLIIAVLPPGRDTPGPVPPHGPRVVHLKLGGTQNANWTLTVTPDRASLAWQNSPANATGPGDPGA